ncbi:MAG: diguanylate cyclase [Clostridiales bacterium]|nr:diguanylate cyclase [Clostridiales bacterium]
MKTIYGRVRLTIFVFVAIISLYIFFAMYLPLKAELEQEIVNSFEQITYNKHILFEQKILKNRQNTVRLSSISSTRNYMAAYIDGRVSLEGLRYYTRLRFDEHLDEFQNLVLAQRYAADGSLIYSLETGKDYAYVIDWSKKELYSRSIPSDNYIYIQSPILDGDRLLGYDIIILDFNPMIDSLADDIYDIDLIVGSTMDKFIREDGKLIAYIPCDYTDGTIVFSVDEVKAFAALRDTRDFVAILNLFGIIVIFAIVQFTFIKYFKRSITTQNRLKNAAQDIAKERNLLIEKMTKGFLEIEVTESKHIGISYVVVSSNNAFRQIVNKRNIEVIGKNLFDVIPLKDTSPLSELIEGASGTDSSNRRHHKECYIDGLDRWWDISVYSPKEGSLALIVDDITERKRLSEKIKENEETLRVIFDVTGEGLWNLDIASGILSHNNRWSKIYAIDDRKIFRHQDEYINMIHPDDRDRVIDIIEYSIANKEKYESEHRMVRSDKKVIWIVDRGTIIRDENGTPIRMLGSVSDITDQKLAEIELIKEKEKFQATLMSVGDGIIATDVDGIITMINPIAEGIIGYKSEEVIGKSLDDTCKLIDSETKQPCDSLNFSSIKRQLMANNVCLSDDGSILLRPDGREIRISRKISTISLPDGEVIGFVTAFRDITLQYEKRKRIEYLSIHDELTGLYNRRYIRKVLHDLDIEGKLPLTAMIIDLNNLKIANDVFGHDKGDELLKKASEFLRNTFRETDFIGRIGGDEFGIVLPNTDAETAKQICDRIHKESYNYVAVPIKLSVAVGFATKTHGNERIESILREADANMYNDKLSSREMVKETLLASFLNRNNENIIGEKEHIMRVSRLAPALYEAIGKSKREVLSFKRAVRVHDVGKIVVPKEIINKVEPLTEDDWRIIKTHTQASYQILRAMQGYEKYAEAVLYHHEHIDGTGYQGLVGDEIPLESRVIAIADAYEAMTADRPYRKALSKEEAIRELRRCSGSQFDGDLVNVFIEKVIGEF